MNSCLPILHEERESQVCSRGGKVQSTQSLDSIQMEAENEQIGFLKTMELIYSLKSLCLPAEICIHQSDDLSSRPTSTF